jgi:hypothetical protein
LFSSPAGAPNPATLLSEIVNGSDPQVYFTLGSLEPTQSGYQTNATTQRTSFSLQNGTVQSTGVVNNVVVTFNYSPVAPFNSGSVISNAVTVLHELGHVYEDLYGLGSTLLVNDSQDTQGSARQSANASASNSKLVQTNCFPGGK